MQKMALADAKAYEAPGHFDVRSIRLQGKDETGVQHFRVGSPTSYRGEARSSARPRSTRCT